MKIGTETVEVQIDKVIEINKQELVDLLIDNFTNKYGDIDISGLDFGWFAGDIYQGGYKLKGSIDQSNHENEGYIEQSRHKNGSYIYQEKHENGGKVWD